LELFREALSDEASLKPVQIKVVLRADVERGAYDKVAVISGNFSRFELCLHVGSLICWLVPMLCQNM
jgi:hypothetical protein